jgi:hypothetical protein
MEKFVTVVSGLPRSGTSMMMRMLEGGGMTVLTDGVRAPDAHNPHGYFELEAVKSLPGKSEWLAGAAGCAVKVVLPLVQILPRGVYRVILMRRAVADIAASQRRLLGSPDVPEPRVERTLAGLYARGESGLRGRPDVRLLVVDFETVVGFPEDSSREIAAFLGLNLGISRMAAAVQRAIHRT